MDWIEEHDESGRAMGRTWPASDRTQRRAAYSMLLAASPAPPPPPAPCFQPHGIRVRGCSSNVGLDHDIDLGGSPSPSPVRLSLGLFIEQVVTSSWLQPVTQATMLLGHVGTSRE
ncbi:hypothetical protein MUK42_35472 [Musa troglodytarum]|nr:hypothetical protein MUK42_35472 [Musa troglodytarum]